MACLRSDVGCRWSVPGVAGQPLRRPELAVDGGSRHFVDSNPRDLSLRPLQGDSDSHAHRQWVHHRRHGRLVSSLGQRHTGASSDAEGLAGFGKRALGHEYSCVCTLVLEARSGGPLMRDRPHALCDSSFLFPQMLSKEEKDSNWKPNFVDYLFLAFNTSTAFSPTDTAVLSRWAKVGTMLQSLISLTIVALLAARAVNIF